MSVEELTIGMAIISLIRRGMHAVRTGMGIKGHPTLWSALEFKHQIKRWLVLNLPDFDIICIAFLFL